MPGGLFEETRCEPLPAKFAMRRVREVARRGLPRAHAHTTGEPPALSQEAPSIRQPKGRPAHSSHPPRCTPGPGKRPHRHRSGNPDIDSNRHTRGREKRSGRQKHRCEHCLFHCFVLLTPTENAMRVPKRKPLRILGSRTERAAKWWNCAARVVVFGQTRIEPVMNPSTEFHNEKGDPSIRGPCASCLAGPLLSQPRFGHIPPSPRMPRSLPSDWSASTVSLSNMWIRTVLREPLPSCSTMASRCTSARSAGVIKRPAAR